MVNLGRMNRFGVSFLGAAVLLLGLMAPALAAPPTLEANNNAARLTALSVLLGLLILGGCAAYLVRHWGNGFSPAGDPSRLSQRSMALAITGAGLAVFGLGVAAMVAGASGGGEPSGLAIRFSPTPPDPWAPTSAGGDKAADAPHLPAVDTGRLTSGGEAIAGAVLELEKVGVQTKVTRVETGADGTFSMPFDKGSHDLERIRVVDLPQAYTVTNPVLISDRMADATDSHPRFVAADSLKPLGLQEPSPDSARGRDRANQLHLAVVPRLELVWPAPDGDATGPLADPMESRIRWRSHPDAAFYVVHFNAGIGNEKASATDHIAYVVAGETSLDLSQLNGSAISIGGPGPMARAFNRHALYGIRVVAFDSQGRVVARTASRAEGGARLRLPAVDLTTLHTGPASKRDPEHRRVGGLVRTMEQKRDFAIASYLAELGRPEEAMYFIDRIEKRRAEGAIYPGGYVGFFGEDQVDRLKQRVCCDNDAKSN